ncbi:hypothetical protein BX616_005737, partial [Lobosporangium transversale]
EMSDSEYALKGITGYLYPEKFADTITINHDDLLYHESSSAPSSNEYDYKGIAGYIYRNPLREATPLLRWWPNENVVHFYCTDPRDEIAPISGY